MERPLFRHDLVSQPVEQEGQQFVDVTDPDTGSTFRFYEVEYAIACAMDGNRDLGGLSAWAREELGLEPSTSELSTVIDTLVELGYLLEGNGASQAPVADEAPALGIGEEVSLGAPGKSPMERSPAAEPPAGADIDLGFSGKSAIEVQRPAPAAADDLELGEAGGVPEFGADPADPDKTPVPQGKPEPAEMEISAEPAGGSGEVSVDLSQHLEVGTDDVKEAVRQSRVMQAVVPELDEPVEPKAAEPAESKPAEPAESEEPPGSEPVVLPSTPEEKPAPVPAAAAAPTPAAESGGSSVMVWLVALLLVVAGAGGAYYYFNVMNKDDVPPPAKPVSTKAVEPAAPAAPKAPTAPLEAGAAAEETVAFARDGSIAWLAEAGVEVEEGAPVAKLAGYEKIEREIKSTEGRKEHYQEKLDKAAAAGNKSAMRAAEAKVKSKQEDIAKLSAELAELVRPAPIAGVVESLVEKGAEVRAGSAVVKITGESSPQATFTVLDASAYERGADATVAAADDPGLTATCGVAAVEGSSVTLACPADSGLTVGTTLVLK